MTLITETLEISVYAPTGPRSVVQRRCDGTPVAQERASEVTYFSLVLKRAHRGDEVATVLFITGAPGIDGGLTLIETDAVEESPLELEMRYVKLALPVKYCGAVKANKPVGETETLPDAGCEAVENEQLPAGQVSLPATLLL